MNCNAPLLKSTKKEKKIYITTGRLSENIYQFCLKKFVSIVFFKVEICPEIFYVDWYLDRFQGSKAPIL